MNVKALLVFIAFLVYSFFAGRYFLCDIKKVCAFETEEQSLEGETADAVSFAYEGYDAIPGNRFETVKLEILNTMRKNMNLHITGLYSPSEENTSGSSNLGLARAMSFRKLFPEIVDSLFSISAEEIPIDDTQKFIEGVIWEFRQNSAFIKETENNVILQFSDEESDVLNNEIEDYLISFANKYANTESYIDLIGHSDNAGSEGDNFTRALNRANMVRSALLSNGMNSDQVNVMSKGGTEPIGDNNTQEGRVANNRVEILIN